MTSGFRLVSLNVTAAHRPSLTDQPTANVLIISLNTSIINSSLSYNEDFLVNGRLIQQNNGRTRRANISACGLGEGTSLSMGFSFPICLWDGVDHELESTIRHQHLCFDDFDVLFKVSLPVPPSGPSERGHA